MSAGSSVILTGSTTGTMGTPAFSVYSATKAALRNFAWSWALDLKGTAFASTSFHRVRSRHPVWTWRLQVQDKKTQSLTT